MGERKVLNRYIPPDFDPSLLQNARIKRTRERFMEIRMMLPFSLRCKSCGEYMYQGKKFNSKKEHLDENYKGIHKIRFYIKCTQCSAEITFKTDPKNADYELESGASRNYEIWKERQQVDEEESNTKLEEEALDPMKTLENKTMDNKMEMDILDALDQIKAINQRHNRIDTDKVLSALHSKSCVDAVKVDPKALTAEDENLIKSIKFKSGTASSTNSSAPTTSANETINVVQAMKQEVLSSLPSTAQALPVIIKKKRKVEDLGSSNRQQDIEPSSKRDTTDETNNPQPSSVLSAPSTVGLFDYGGDSDSSNS